jgi:hypothetical protein
MRTRLTLVLVLAVLTAGVAQATTVTYSGFLSDPANTALVASDLGPALFVDDYDIANNVAVYDFTLLAADNVRFQSLGFAVGGVDPYFTLFAGSGPSATFFDSNYAQAFSTGGDFDLTFALTAGDYRIALGAFANMSIAENYGTGTFADGFTFLGAPYVLGTYYYELQVTDSAPAVPEPATWLLVLSGLALTRLLIKH